MRLLQTKTLKLREFFGGKIPPYAILSHTWGEEEVSLQELQLGFSETKAGYDKIRRCCEMAASDGFQYVWVDTCCIDKTSSAELSEAINSMFSWYRVADICYVYLFDVRANLSPSDTEKAIRKSRWFTRGWTLQELIAPASVLFFDQEWSELGSKQSLEKVITKTTKIHEEVLRDARSLAHFSVAQKMSWASKRTTTRVEDIAYCLLGIFGVHMPMLYGEGSHAFVRLQEEIIKNTTDHTIFAWTTEFSYCDGLLADSPVCFKHSRNFVQREKEAVSPFSSTNKGIHLYLPVYADAGSKICVAFLDCYEIGSENKRLGINIQRLQSPGMFKRRGTEQLQMVDKKQVSSFKREDIFVKQQRTMAESPDYINYAISVKELEQRGIRLRDSIPVRESMVLDVESDTIKLPRLQSTLKPETFAFRFVEKNSEDGCVVLLQRRWGHFEIVPAAVVLGGIPDQVFPSSPQYTGASLEDFFFSRKGQKARKQLQENEEIERIFWQHPRGGWGIQVTFKNGMVSNKRTKIVRITRYIPRKNDEPSSTENTSDSETDDE